jgi:hypothetical protein
MVGICGNMRAGFLDKRLSKEEISPEDWGFLTRRAAGDWLSRCQVSRLAKLGAGSSLKSLADTGTQPGVGLREYAKPPAKCRRTGNEEEADKSPSWVDVEAEGVGFQEIRSWDPLTSQDEIKKLLQENFDLLRRETVRANGNWSDALRQIRESTKQLMSAQSQTEILVGTPGALEQVSVWSMLSTDYVISWNRLEMQKPSSMTCPMDAWLD